MQRGCSVSRLAHDRNVETSEKIGKHAQLIRHRMKSRNVAVCGIDVYIELDRKEGENEYYVASQREGRSTEDCCYDLQECEEDLRHRERWHLGWRDTV